MFPPHRLTGLSADFSEGMADAAVRAERWQDAIFYVGQMPDERKEHPALAVLAGPGAGGHPARLGTRPG